MESRNRIIMQIVYSIAVVILSWLMFLAIDNVNISDVPYTDVAIRLISKSILAGADLICITLINLPRKHD